MWFWKKDKNNNPIYRKSIGEKIRYHQGRLNNSDPKIREKAKTNLYRLNRIANGKESSFGKVFMVKDKIFNPSASEVKPRRVVCVGVEKGKMKVIPVKKNKNIIHLSKFDNQRDINTKLVKTISFNEVYEKRTFKNTTNDYLTSNKK